MNRNTLTVGIALATWAYWMLFYAFVFLDAYLDRPMGGLVLKGLFPVMLAVNLTGIAIGCASRTKSRLQTSILLILNAVPLATAVCFFWWLFFGVAI